MAHAGWKPSRRDALKALEGIGVSSLVAGCETFQKQHDDDHKPHNIVVICSDDHRYDFMSFVDEPTTPSFLETPNLDRLARGGVHASNAFASTSLCGPSRATMLTGQYAHTHRVLNNTRPIPSVEDTFPERLQTRGYDTAFVGKWHLFQSDSPYPRPGFDHWVSFKGQGQYFGQDFNVNGRREKRTGYITDNLTDAALDWLRSEAGDRPFFLFLSHKAVHHPWRPAPRHKGRYSGVSIDRPVTFDETLPGGGDKPDWVVEQRTKPFGVGSRNYGRLYRKYCETILALDESVGAVMDYLEGAGLADETLLVYLSDNGFLLGEHGLIDKRVAYEPSIRIPLVTSAPGRLEPGTEVTQLTANIDLAPTLLDFANVPTPTSVDGRSVRPLLTPTEHTEWRDALLYEYFWSPKFPHPPGEFALRTSTSKYVLSYGRPDTNEFYDLTHDRHERHNRIDADGYQQQISQLKERLFDRLKTTGSVLNPVLQQA